MTSQPAQYFMPLLATASLLLTACSDDSTRKSAPPTQSTSPTEQVDDIGDAQPKWKLLSKEPGGVPVAAGAYGLTANGVSDRVAVVQAPEGYQNFGGWAFGIDEDGTDERFMGFVTAYRVPPDPCGSKAHSKFDAASDPGPTVENLADALVAQKGVVSSKPVSVSIDGYSGLYLRYQVAKGIDVPKCEARAFDIFSTGPDGAWYLEASRERAAIWILNVDDERLVLGWVAKPGVTHAQMREMTDMAQSARFVDSR